MNKVKSVMKIEASRRGMTVEALSTEIEGFLGKSGRDLLHKSAAIGLQPLKDQIPYESRARKIFAPYKLAQGEDARFDRDINVPAYQLSINGLPQMVSASSARVQFDTRPIAAGALVKWTEAAYRKFDVMDWVATRAKASLLEQEDSYALSVLAYAADASNAAGINTTITSPGVLMYDKLIDAKAQLEANTNSYANFKLVCSAKTAADLKFIRANVSGQSAGATYGTIFVPEMQEEVLRSGVIGKVDGNIDVISFPKKRDGSAFIADNVAYLVAEPEILGVMPIRTELFSKEQPAVLQGSDIILYQEEIGFYIHNPRAIQKITINR